MPNGFDRVYVELRMACAGYRIRFDAWPRIIELHPSALWGLAVIFDRSAFERLAERLEFRMVRDSKLPPDVWIDAVGEHGRVRLQEAIMDFDRFRTVEGVKEFDSLFDEAQRWLAVEPHEPSEHELREPRSSEGSDDPSSM